MGRASSLAAIAALVLSACGTTDVSSPSMQSSPPTQPATTAKPKPDRFWQPADEFSFSVSCKDCDEAGYPWVQTGVFSADEGLLFLTTTEQYVHLARFVDGEAFDAEGYELVSVWVEPSEDTIVAGEMLIDLFEGVVSGSPPVGADVTVQDHVDGESTASWAVDVQSEWAKAIGPIVEYRFEPGGTVRLVSAGEGQAVVTLADFGDIAALPDPSEFLMPMDLFSDEAHPIVRDFVTASYDLQERRASGDCCGRFTPVAEPNPEPLWIDPEDVVGGAILFSHGNASGTIGENYGQGPAEAASDCYPLDEFNEHHGAIGYIRIQRYSGSVESNGGFWLQNAEFVYETAQRISSECPTVSFVDGGTGIVERLTVELPPGWHGFRIDFDDGRRVLYAYGLRERLLSVDRIEYEIPANDGADEAGLAVGAEISARRLNEASARPLGTQRD